MLTLTEPPDRDLHDWIVISTDTKLHDCRDARRKLNVRNRMFLRGGASDHRHHFELV